MKIALFGTNQLQFSKVYTPDVLADLEKYGELSPKINKKNIEKYASFLKDCEIGFATWGMPKFTKEEIRKYMPKLKAVFYAAGTVQYFARPFLEAGVKIFSAYAANAVPVTEYAFAQITLAVKGYFQAAKFYRSLPVYSLAFANTATGNYKCKVGLAGLGAIGQAVAERLKSLDAEVYAYDPFVSPERAEELNVTLTDLETLFPNAMLSAIILPIKKSLKRFSITSFSKR